MTIELPARVAARGVWLDQSGALQAPEVQTALERLATSYNVQDYGAKGDATTDDTAAIQAAASAAAGGTLVFPEPDASYLLGSTVNLPSNIRVICAPGVTFKVSSGWANETAMFLIDGKTNVTFEGGVLNGQRTVHTNQQVYGIWVKAASSRIRIRNVEFKDISSNAGSTLGGDGFLLSRTSTNIPDDVVVENCRFVDCDRQGLTVFAGKRVTIRDCRFTNGNTTAGRNGVDIEPISSVNDLVDQVLIEGCKFYSSFQGVTVGNNVQTTSQITILGCWFNGLTHATNAAIVQGTNATGVVIDGCHFIDNKADDVQLRSRTTVVGCEFNQAAVTKTANTYFVRSAGQSNWRVVGCSFRVQAAAQTAVSIDSTSNRGQIVGCEFDLGGFNVRGINIENGARFVVAGNMLTNTGPTGTGIDLRAVSSASTNHVVVGNSISGFSLGIQIANGVTNSRIGPNDTTGCTTRLTDNANDGSNIIVYEPTIGGEVQRLSTVATNNDPRESVYQNRVATTDATATTIHTVTIPASTTVGLHVSVTARRTGGTAGTAEDGAHYLRAATYKNVAGTATLIGSASSVHTAKDQAGWDVTFNVSTNTVQIQVTGAANNVVTWHATLRTWQVGS